MANRGKKFRRSPEGLTTFTEEQDEIIKKNYLSIPVKTLAESLGSTYCGLTGRMRQLKLVIPREIIEQRKIDSQRKPGSIPYNKGKKQSEYLSPEQIAKCRETSFKKGNIPHNTASGNGEIRTRQDSKGRKYKWIRISLGKWIMYHVFLWEQVNGKVPEGNIIVFDVPTILLSI